TGPAIGAKGLSSCGRLSKERRSQRLLPIPAMHERRPGRSRKPTVLTRSSSPSSAEQAVASADGSLPTVTTRKTAARDRGASMLCASIGTLSQFLSDITRCSVFLLFARLKTTLVDD